MDEDEAERLAVLLNAAGHRVIADALSCWVWNAAVGKPVYAGPEAWGVRPWDTSTVFTRRKDFPPAWNTALTDTDPAPGAPAL